MTEKCKECGSENIIMMEYLDYKLPKSVDYDGISEIRCQDCGSRFGRWSGIKLKDNEVERRYGGKPVKIKLK